ncbi:MAG: hypothetical protein OHK0022_44920 [Roseiflexaceae bacterium]
MSVHSPGAAEGSCIQRFAIHEYDDYQGYLASEDTIRSTQRVKEMIRLLRRGETLSNDEPIKAVKNVKMVRETNPEVPWQYINQEEYEGDDDPEVLKRHIITDGHHRFVAHVEVFDRPPNVANDTDYAIAGYSWSSMGGLDEEYDLDDDDRKVDDEDDDDREFDDQDFELDSSGLEYDQWKPIALEVLNKVDVTRPLDMPLEQLLMMAYNAGYTANMFGDMMENGTW